MMSMINKSTIPNRTIQRALMLGCVLLLPVLSGCTAILSPIDTIPAERLPPQFLAEPQADKVPIDVSRLRQPKPAYYQMDKGDVLGVFIEGVLGTVDEAPPVVMPEQGSDLPPAIGFPVPVREDGTISLPLVKPIPVRGLNIQQVEQLVSRTYRDGEKPLLTDDARIIVTLMRERTYRVFVVRQDNSTSFFNPQFGGGGQGGGQGAVSNRSDFSSRGFVLQMPAYKNDVLNALSQSGGMPGVNAESEIRVLRGDRVSQANRDREINEFYRSHSAEEFPYSVLPAVSDESNVLKIPTRLNPGEQPQIRTEDIILKDGDILYVDSRETDFYYTGGLLRGGEFLIPRDYDLDVIGAMSVAGNSIGTGNQIGQFGSGVQGVPPTELIVLRRLPGKQQVAIRIDVNRAINNPRSRILVMAGDTLILRFKPQEELVNFGIGAFFTYGISALFRGR